MRNSLSDFSYSIPWIRRCRFALYCEMSIGLGRGIGFNAWQLLCVVCASLCCCVSSAMAEVSFWYEDNNLQRAGGCPDDFEEMFTSPDSWKELRSQVSVYYIRGSSLRNVRDDLGEDFFINKFCIVAQRSVGRVFPRACCAELCLPRLCPTNA